MPLCDRSNTFGPNVMNNTLVRERRDCWCPLGLVCVEWDSQRQRRTEAMSQAAAQPRKSGSRWSHDAPFDSWFGLVRHVTAGGLAGLTAGFLVGGVGGRVFMRIAGAASGTRGSGRVTEAGFTVGEVTFGGSGFLIVFLGIASGIAGAGIYLAMRPWLGWAHRLRGVVFGVVLFALTSATSDLMNPDNVDFFILGNGPLLVALIVGLFVGFGVVIDWVFRWLDHRLPGEERGWRSVGVPFAVFAVVGTMAVLSLGSAILSGGGGFCDCDSPVLASWSFLVVFVSTSVMWICAIARLPSWVARAATVTGYLGTAGVLIFGLIRAISDASEIIN